MFTAWTPHPACWVPRVHAVCWHNECAALVKRTLGPTPTPADPRCPELAGAFARLRALARRYDGTTWTHLQTAESYSGLLRRRYIDAEKSLLTEGPVHSGDVRLKAFLKAEKRGLGALAKPRMIYPRSPRYNLDLASRLKPFEHWLWGNLRSIGLSGVPPSRVCAKGLSPQRRANLIVRKFRQLTDCVVFEVDGKAFEAHVDAKQLGFEHSVYRAAFPGDRGLDRLLQYQLTMRGVTSCGLRFSRSGGRASGDFNTGMGNSLIMLAVVSSVMSVISPARYDSLVDGDNALIFIERADYRRVVECFAPEALRVSGHEMVLERPVSVIEGIRFGQSAPVETSCGWMMVRDWRKVLSHATSSHVHLREARFAREFLFGVALCELSLAREVPIIGRWAESLRAATRVNRPVRLHPHRDYQAMGVDFDVVASAKFVPPSLVSRLSFERAFGVSPDEQCRIESSLADFPSLGRFLQLDGEEYVNQDMWGEGAWTW